MWYQTENTNNRKPRRCPMPQGVHSLCLRLLEPLAHRTLGDSESLGDVFLFPSVLMPLSGTHPSSFAPLFGRGRLLAHTSFSRRFAFFLYVFLLRSRKKKSHYSRQGKAVCGMSEARHAERSAGKPKSGRIWACTGESAATWRRRHPGNGMVSHSSVGTMTQRQQKPIHWVRF
jgi:hypothetical protein